MSACLIGLGSNLGNRQQTLDQAVARLAGHPQMHVRTQSSRHETLPIGGPDAQAPFLNGAIVVETSLGPQSVLETLQDIERALGRRRDRHWGPRTIDLDLLLYDQQVLDTPALVLPHPRMAWRRFVLQPSAEVAPSMVHPTTGWTIARLLDHLDTAAPYVAITGSIGAGKTSLAKRLAQQTAARLIAEPLDLKLLERFYADPAGNAWETELEFLHQRARLLAADSPPWSDRGRLVVSDFWFDQSAAFARVWLPPQRREAYDRQWERLHREVVRPKLIVLLDIPAERLSERIVRRGRIAEQGLGEEQLERIRRAILARATRVDQGPLLRLTDDDLETTFTEVLAAVQAMEA